MRCGVGWRVDGRVLGCWLLVTLPSGQQNRSSIPSAIARRDSATNQSHAVITAPAATHRERATHDRFSAVVPRRQAPLHPSPR